MDDMNAFDRQLASVVLRRVGPSEPVDDAAIFSAITATQSPKWRFQTMFSATKFVVAGAVLALVGGFLLTGVLTQQPSDERLPVGASASATAQAEATDAATIEPEPTTVTDGTTAIDLLSGVDLVTEEVEPGVYRVLSDGVGHDLVARPPSDLTVAPDGSVWLLRMPQGDEAYWTEEMGPARFPTHQWVDGVFELGRERTYDFEPRQICLHCSTDLAVDTDGVPWVWDSNHRDLRSFDGSAWVSHAWPNGAERADAVEATADGAVWVTRTVKNGPGPRVARLVDGEWTVLPTLDDPALEGLYRGRHASFAAAPDGTAWLGNRYGRLEEVQGSPKGLLHFDGERWEVVDLPIDGDNIQAGPLALGPDGTLWVYLERTYWSDTDDWLYLARLDGDGWSVFSRADGVPFLDGDHVWEGRMAVDGDGRLWLTTAWDTLNATLHVPDLDEKGAPYGVLSFDGSEWRQYLDDIQVNRVDVAPDGAVFAAALWGCTDECQKQKPSERGQAIDWSLGGLYVITPEAVQ